MIIVVMQANRCRVNAGDYNLSIVEGWKLPKYVSECTSCIRCMYPDGSSGCMMYDNMYQI